VRLRRVVGRVIDVVYLEHNLEYAEVVRLALSTGDNELHRLGFVWKAYWQQEQHQLIFQQ
jgi:hypothetical protein